MEKDSLNVELNFISSKISQFLNIVLKGFDFYADFCDYLVTSILYSLSMSNTVVNEFLNTFMDAVSWLMSIPITIFTVILKLFHYIFLVLFFPLRIAHATFINFPILSTICVAFILSILFLIRRITRQSAVQYVLYTLIPYGLSIVYTVLGFFFPQLGIFSRVIGVLLNPINTILDLLAKISSRAEPIRNTVRLVSPPRDKNKQLNRYESMQEQLNNSRIQCCVCICAEKTILVRPCNHLCLCQTCLTVILRQPIPKCPICRCAIEEHMNVYL